MLGAVGAWLAKAALMSSPIGAFLYAIGRGLKRFLGALDLQGWIGLVLGLLLAWQWISSAGEARHWKKQSAGFEALYRREHLAFGQTVLNYRVAAEKARQADAANAVRVHTEQLAINERTAHDFEARIADARAVAQRLRDQLAAAANSGPAGTAPMPGVPAAGGGAAQGPGQDGLSIADRLLATEQAIQLDELIKWVRRQAGVDPNRAKKP